MDLSVIIPCHNLEKFITPLLVSLKLQFIQQEKIELIFVCDNCTDNTKRIIEEFEWDNKYENVLLADCNVRACGLARNVGLELAKGRIIMFADGDDWYCDPLAFHTVIRTFSSNQIQVMRFAYEAPGFKAIGHPAMVWQYAYRREVIGNIRFTYHQPHEDLEFNQKIINKVGFIPFFEYKLYHYNYMREGSNVQQYVTKGRIDP